MTIYGKENDMGKTEYKAIKINGVKHNYHRWLMEQKLGRKLDSNEVVHHVNEDKQDNDVSNLCLMSRSEHAKLHAKPPYFSDYARERYREVASNQPAHNRKLTEEDVEYIKKTYIPRDRTYGARALARKYGVGHTSILKIMQGEFYKKF